MVKKNLGKEHCTSSIKDIKVAILAEEPLFWGSRKYYHKTILDNYSWKIGHNIYRISADYIYDKDIVSGKLNKSNFDVLLVPGGGVGNNQALMKGFNFCRNVKQFKKNIADFIKSGGGYIGLCGGAALITNLVKDPGSKPRSFVEKQYDKSELGVSCVSSYFKNLAFPLFYPFQYNHPEKIGNSAYAFSFAPGETIDGKRFFSTGCPIEVYVLKDNAIFSDHDKKTRRIRWWAGQALIVPEKTDREIKVLAKYPIDDLSHRSTNIYAWRYIGGLRGIFKSFFISLKFIKSNKLCLKQLPLFIYYLAGDWECTKKIITLDNGEKPCITAELYPNENKGRILLSTVHPEYMIWWGGHIEENLKEDVNCIGRGFHYWKDINKLSEDLQDELTYNWWILRRFVAWTGKVPDAEMPPTGSGEFDNSRVKKIKEGIFWNGDFLSQLNDI